MNLLLHTFYLLHISLDTRITCDVHDDLYEADDHEYSCDFDDLCESTTYNDHCDYHFELVDNQYDGNE